MSSHNQHADDRVPQTYRYDIDGKSYCLREASQVERIEIRLIATQVRLAMPDLTWGIGVQIIEMFAELAGISPIETLAKLATLKEDVNLVGMFVAILEAGGVPRGAEGKFDLSGNGFEIHQA